MPLRPTAIAVEPRPDYCLLITFDNAEKRVFDVKPYLAGKLFEELRNPVFFRLAAPAGLSVEWPHGQDICPDELYYNSVPAN